MKLGPTLHYCGCNCMDVLAKFHEATRTLTWRLSSIPRILFECRLEGFGDRSQDAKASLHCRATGPYQLVG